jgi:AraC-like DNA-binding protein
MAFYTLPPPPELRPFVRFFWVFELNGIRSADVPYVYRSMADGCPELLFHYKGLFREVPPTPSVGSSRLTLHAQSSRFARYQIQEDFGIFGAYLYPFATEALLGIPADALSDTETSLEGLLGSPGRVLEERLLDCGTQWERHQILSGFLTAALRRRRPRGEAIHECVKKVIEQKGIVDISLLAQEQNLSARQFQRKFRKAAGYSPKRYTRILRFMEVASRDRADFSSLTALAYAHAYYDQSHFIHEFKAFSGYAPREFFSGTPEGREWLTG